MYSPDVDRKEARPDLLFAAHMKYIFPDERQKILALTVIHNVTKISSTSLLIAS